MRNDYFDTGAGKLYFEIAGEANEETIVLNHAAFVDSRMWDAQWPLLAEHYRVIRYDMMGFGKSDKVTGPRTRRDDLLALLRALDVADAHLVGCSMGGEIMLDLALEQPALVRSLTLVNSTPSGFELQGEPPQYLFEMIGALQTGDVEHASELQLRIWVDGPQRAPEQVDPTVRQRAAIMNQIFVANNTWAIADMQPHSPLDPPAIEQLGDVRVPTLVVKGLLDHSENLRAADLLAAGIPNAQVVEVREAAHVPSMEQPAQFNEALLKFFAAK